MNNLIICVVVGIIGGCAYFLFLRIHSAISNWINKCPCPKCGNKDITLTRTGFWDGEDEKGKSCGGLIEYATCSKCGTRLIRSTVSSFIPKKVNWDVDDKANEEDSNTSSNPTNTD